MRKGKEKKEVCGWKMRNLKRKKGEEENDGKNMKEKIYKIEVIKGNQEGRSKVEEKPSSLPLNQLRAAQPQLELTQERMG